MKNSTIKEVFVQELKSPITNPGKFKGFIAVGYSDDHCHWNAGCGDTAEEAVEYMLNSFRNGNQPTDSRLIVNRRCFEIK